MTHRHYSLGILLLLLTAGGTAIAQDTESPERSEMAQQFYQEVSEFAIGYWVPRLNGYKVRIDRSLPTSDLATLDALRIQWGIAIERESRENESAETTSHAPYHVDTSGVDAATAETGALEPARRGEPTENDLFESTKGIAERNRERMDAIHRLVRADMNDFIEKGAAFVDRFLEKNREKIIADGDEEVLEGWNEIRGSMFSPTEREDLLTWFDQFYQSGAESFIMLYNGEDVFRLLGVALPASAPLSELNLEKSSMLAQNIPNPAGTSTRIGYTLTAPSSSTSLEIFDASGARMLSIDEGARAVGEHSVVVDLSKLSAGSYLYRLTIQGEQGEQVSSRVMQVVR